MSRAVARLLPLVVLLGVLAGVVLLVRARVGAAAGAVNADCFGDLNRTTYTSGFQATDFSAITAADINASGINAGVQLDTNLQPLDSQHIVLPFDQDVKIKFLYRLAGGSHTLGWFYFDQVQPFLDGTGKLADADADGIPDFFQTSNGATRPNMGLWEVGSGSINPILTRSSMSYSDGGSFPHIPNLLEGYVSHGGGWIFYLCDDDSDTTTFGNYAPVSDIGTLVDGIVDYDINGDNCPPTCAAGQRELDRTVDLGIIKGGREVVFFAMFYYDAALEYPGLGVAGTPGTRATKIIPWFTKNTLNPDFDTTLANTQLQKIAIGCTRDDNTCYTPKGATLGWLDSAAMTRLNTPTYDNIDLTGDNTVYTMKYDAAGNVPHFVVFPPASDPNRWLIAFDDQPEYSTSTSDADYNDVVFLIERTNGGEVISQNLATDILPGDLATTMINKVRFRYTAMFPSPGCDGVSDAEVRIYYSVDGVKWRQVPFSSKTSGDVTVDVLRNGDVGNQLFWKADFVSSSQFCQPVLQSMNVGYEAVKHGEFKFAAPIPLSNQLYAGSVETPASTWTVTNNDFSLRGHFYDKQTFDPSTLSDSVVLEWDAGQRLSTTNPDSRVILTSDGSGNIVPFTTASGGTLYAQLLSTATRALKSNGLFVYDYNGDLTVDDKDAQHLLQWTRGWEWTSGVTYTPTPATQPLQRAWKLGPIHNSSPALVGPPGHPLWLDGTAAPKNLIAAFDQYQLANTKRRTLAVVGAQDGMLHAFDAGQFRFGADPDCHLSTPLVRGCFATVGATPDYGSGGEVWAYVPTSQLSQLKNNVPFSAAYLPANNPPAEVDGSISAEDIYLNGAFVTGIFASLGREQPYVTALYITADQTSPKPLWAADWTDPDFNGSELSPAVGLTSLPSNKVAFTAVISSGLDTVAGDEFMFFIDPTVGTLIKNGSGTTIGKVKLNGTDPGAYGIAGYPNLIDANGDGLSDRVYAVDTSGRIFKVDTTNMTTCQLGSIGESAFTGMAVSVLNTNPPKIQLFVGGAPNPDGTANPPLTAPYHLFGLEDDDPVGTCTTNSLTTVYTQTLNATDKLWAAPFAAGSSVFFATSAGNSESVCATGTGSFFGIQSNGTGTAYSIVSPVAALPGAAVSSIRIYDGHAFVDTVNGTTTQIGGSGWNNTNAANTATRVMSLDTKLWQEM